MALLPRFCLVFFVLVGSVAGETNLAVDRNPPPVFARHIAGLLTKYEDTKAGKTAFPSGESDEIVLVSESIQFRDDDGTRYRAQHQIYFAVGASAVERLGNSIYSFDRERESVFLVEAATILPDGQRLPVTGKGAFIQTPQHEAENSLYTSQAELNLVFPNVAPGAATEAIVLIRENTPVMPGEFCTDFSFHAGWPTFLRRFVVDLPDTEWPRIHTLLSGSASIEPQVEKPDSNRTRKTWSQRLTHMSVWEEGSPSYEFRSPTLWLTTLNSWDDVAAWFHKLASDRSDLGPELAGEVDKLTGGLTEPRQIVDKLCSVVANEVRYTGLEFGLAGYQPAPCRDVWEHRYGDCKDKANLLRAMLAHKGIRSHLVLLNADSLGYVEKGSPSWRHFDHVILAVEDAPGHYLFCDPTIKHLPAGMLGSADRAREVMVDNDGHAQWVHTEDLLDPGILVTGDLTLGPDGNLNGWYTFVAAGNTGAFYADYYNGMEKDDRHRSVQGYVAAFFPGADVVDIDYQPVVGSVEKIQLRAYLRRPARSNGRESINFPYPTNWLPSVDTAGERKFPYGGTTHREEAVDVRITLPEGWGADALPAAFNASSDAADFAASWTSKGNILQAQLRWAPRKAELSPAEYGAFQRSVRALVAWLAQTVVVAPKSDQAMPVVTASPTKLERFPILPTGEGQLRLLNEEFPSGKDDAQRRTALAQVLQWFPHDAETVFTAEVDLALLDEDRLGNRVFADKVATLLAAHGNSVSLAARKWGEYLEDVARWHADKSRAALEHLRRMAADPSVPLFRRGWAAYEAARAMAESKPAAAADFLEPYCDLETDAQNDNEIAVVIWRIQTNDGKKLAHFLDQVKTRHHDDSAAIMEKILNAVSQRWAESNPAARATALEAFGRALAPAERFPKAVATLEGLRRGVEAEAARRDFTEELTRWLQAHPTKLWSASPLKQYPDADAAIKVIEATNKSGDPAKLVEATLHLITHNDPSFAAFAKYTDWAIWWLGKDHLADELFEKLGTMALKLPPGSSEDVVDCWSDFALALAKRGDPKRARTVLEKILNTPEVKDYQKVGAGGELGLLALRAGEIDQALDSFRKIEPIHTTNKFGVDYLYAALLVELERGNFDRGLEIVARIREQQTKYIKDAANSSVLEVLLRAGEHPEALKQFWQRRTRWRTQWDQLLTRTGLTPAPLQEPPVKIDWGGREEKITKAAATRDEKAYLRLLDDAARTAQWVPAAVINFQENADASDPFSAEFQRALHECALAMVAAWQPVDPQVDDSAQMWEGEMNLALQRKTEAAATARALYAKIGADKNAGEVALRIWVIASRGTDEEPEAIAALTRLCSENRTLSNRIHSVRVLSDSLSQRGDMAADLALLERETARADFARTSDDGKALLARLEEHRQQHSAATDLTTIVSEWKDRNCSRWFARVGPDSLDDPRCSGTKEPMTATTAGFSNAERAKFNLLFALDERQEIGARENAFVEVVVSVSPLTRDIDNCANLLLEGSENRKLGSTARRNLLVWAIFMAMEYRRADLLSRCARAEAISFCSTEFRNSLSATTEAVQMLADQPAQRRADAFRILTRLPLDFLRYKLTEQLLHEMSVNGQGDQALDLVAKAGALAIDKNFTQTPAGVRLQWTRGIQTAADLAPLVHKLEALLASVPAAMTPPDKRIRNRLHSFATTDLTATEDAQLAVWWLSSGQVGTPAEFGATLDDLWSAAAEQVLPVDFGPELFETALSLKLDDSVKALILANAFGFCDQDIPEVCRRVDEQAKKFLSSPAASRQPETLRSLADIRATIASRTSKEDRPDPLFGPLAISKLPGQKLRQMQLLFHHSRGNWSECDSIVASLDPEAVKSAFTLAAVRASLERNQRAAEIPAIVEVVQESMRGDLATMWFDPVDRAWSSRACSFVEWGGMDKLIPDSLYDTLLANCQNARHRARLQFLQAKTRSDWKNAIQACDEILRVSPTTYSYFYERAELERKLGRNEEAKKDLIPFLTHALNDTNYQAAVQMQKTVDGGSSQAASP